MHCTSRRLLALHPTDKHAHSTACLCSFAAHCTAKRSCAMVGALLNMNTILAALHCAHRMAALQEPSTIWHPDMLGQAAHPYVDFCKLLPLHLP